MRVVESLRAEAEPFTGPVTFEEEPASPATVPIQVSDSRLARDELSWRRRISFAESIKDMWSAALQAKSSTGAQQ